MSGLTVILIAIISYFVQGFMVFLGAITGLFVFDKISSSVLKHRKKEGEDIE